MKPDFYDSLQEAMESTRGFCLTCRAGIGLSDRMFERIFRPLTRTTEIGTYSRGPFCRKCVLLAGGVLFTITADDMDLEEESFPELPFKIFRPLFKQVFVEVNYGEERR